MLVANNALPSTRALVLHGLVQLGWGLWTFVWSLMAATYMVKEPEMVPYVLIVGFAL